MGGSLYLRGSMSSNVTPGPNAPENNPPIQPQDYQPSKFDISAITLGVTTTVTTSTAHNYVIGQLTRLLISRFYGSYQLNQQEGMVISIPSSTQVVLNINSAMNVNAFISSPTYGPTPPKIVAVGDYNSGAINSNGRTQNITYVLGSFINIS